MIDFSFVPNLDLSKIYINIHILYTLYCTLCQTIQGVLTVDDRDSI